MSQEASSTETITKDPVGTQEVPVEKRKKVRPTEIVELPEDSKDLGEAVQEALDDMFAVTAWKPKHIVKFKIPCPSGQVVLVKHMDILELASADLVEDMDLFSRKLLPSRFDAQGRPEDDEPDGNIWKSMVDVKKQLRFMDMTNRLMALCSIKPKIINDGVIVSTDPDTGKETLKFGYQMTVEEQLEHFKKPVAPLGDNEVYAGYVNFADRMAFFVELQKPMELIEPFRERSASVLQNLEPGESAGVPSE